MSSEIKKQIRIPLVADIHFNYKLALIALEQGVDGLRLNPGNIGGKQLVQEVVNVAKDKKIPIREAPAALKAFFNIAARWKLRDEDARALLGGVSNGPFYEMKRNPARTLDAERGCSHVQVPGHRQRVQQALDRCPLLEPAR